MKYGDQTILEEIFYRVDHASYPGQKFCDTNADARDLFAVSDLLVYLCQGGYAFVFVRLSVSRITKKFSTSSDETVCTGETCD